MTTLKKLKKIKPSTVNESVEVTGQPAEVDVPAAAEFQTVHYLPIASVLPDPEQPRKFFDQELIHSLAVSIKEHGFINPITVRQVDGVTYIIAGEQRFRAAQEAGLEKVPCIVNNSEKYMELALVENYLRSDLTAVEKAEALQKLVSSGIKQKDLAVRLGKKPSTIADIISIASLPELIKDECRADSSFAIRELKRIATAPAEQQEKMFDQYKQKKQVNLKLTANRSTNNDVAILKAVKLLGSQLKGLETITEADKKAAVFNSLNSLNTTLSGLLSESDLTSTRRGTVMLQEEVAAWAKANLPPEADHLRKLQEELDELMGKPSDPHEIGDLILSLFIHASDYGIDAIAAAAEKFEIVKQRTYSMTDDGQCRHLKVSASVDEISNSADIPSVE